MFAKAGWTEARTEHKQDATSMHRCEVEALSSTHDVDIVSANGIQEPPGPVRAWREIVLAFGTVCYKAWESILN